MRAIQHYSFNLVYQIWLNFVVLCRNLLRKIKWLVFLNLFLIKGFPCYVTIHRGIVLRLKKEALPPPYNNAKSVRHCFKVLPRNYEKSYIANTTVPCQVLLETGNILLFIIISHWYFLTFTDGWVQIYVQAVSEYWRLRGRNVFMMSLPCKSIFILL